MQNTVIKGNIGVPLYQMVSKPKNELKKKGTKVKADTDLAEMICVDTNLLDSFSALS